MSATGVTNLKSEIDDLKTERILVAATSLFSEKGYANCTMNDIARAIGVTKPFLYYRFKDKADILAAICGRGADLVHSATVEVMGRDAPASVRLEEYCREFVTTVLQYADFILVYAREVANLRPEDRHAIAGVRTATVELVQDLLRTGQGTGEFDPLDPMITARSINGMLSFVAEWHPLHRDVSREQVIARTTHLALRMAGANRRSASLP